MIDYLEKGSRHLLCVFTWLFCGNCKRTFKKPSKSHDCQCDQVSPQGIKYPWVWGEESRSSYLYWWSHLYPSFTGMLCLKKSHSPAKAGTSMEPFCVHRLEMMHRVMFGLNPQQVCQSQLTKSQLCKLHFIRKSSGNWQIQNSSDRYCNLCLDTEKNVQDSLRIPQGIPEKETWWACTHCPSWALWSLPGSRWVHSPSQIMIFWFRNNFPWVRWH